MPDERPPPKHAAEPAPTGGAGRRAATWAAVALALAFLAVALPLLRDYGPTWDCARGEYPYGEALLAYLLDPSVEYLERAGTTSGLEVRQPHPDFDVGRQSWVGVYPLTAFFGAAFCQVFWTELGWVPAMAAHHVPLAVLVAVLLFVLVRAAALRYGVGVGIAAGLFLACSPRFFAHSFNNLKDVPSTCFIALATLVLFLALTRGGWGKWLAGGVLMGIAVAQRPNALFLPAQFLAFVLVAVPYRRFTRRAPLPWSWGGLALATVASFVTYVALGPEFWTSTLERLADQASWYLGLNFYIGTENPATSTRMGSPGTSFHGIVQFLSTTPTPLLFLAMIGLFSLQARFEERLMLLLAVAVPLARTLIPGMFNYDGVRHFLEFYPPLALLGALGLRAVSDLAVGGLRLASRPPLARTVAALVWAAFLGPCAWWTWRTHPNGIAYFNVYAGGLRGAQESGDGDATDYWGNSYWQGLAWVSAHAEPDATLIVTVAGHVARCAAPVRLRPDVRLARDASEPLRGPLYVMYVTRFPRYHALTRSIDATNEPAHEILCQGAPILRIHRFEGRAAERVWERFAREAEAGQATRRLADWFRAHAAESAEARRWIQRRKALGNDEVLARVKGLLPAELHADAEQALWLLFRTGGGE